MTTDVVMYRRYLGTAGSTWTTDTQANVGTGSNRYAFLWVLTILNTTPTPDTASVGTDTLTALTSVTSDPAGYKVRLFGGPLTVTGNQTLSGTMAGGSTAGATVRLWVVQGTGSLTISDVLANQNNSSGSSGNVSRTVSNTTTSDEVCIFAIQENVNQAATAQSPATLATGADGYMAAARRTGASGSTAIQLNYAAAYEVTTSAWRITDAGGATNAPRAHYYRMLQAA